MSVFQDTTLHLSHVEYLKKSFYRHIYIYMYIMQKYYTHAIFLCVGVQNNTRE